uniref:PIH1 domain-containing protein 2 n=1 Tax=Arion vulgaris TaxID=1028688 RepID=A0A0B7A7Y4_9EUPU
MENVKTEALSAQAQQLWSMLDDMSENNPTAYKKFIQQQMKEAKEHMSPPESHMCVQVTLLSKTAKPLFINFCSWKHVPEPKSSEDPVPVVGTPISQEKDDTGSFSLVSVAFNPRVLEKYGRHAKNHVDGDTLVQLALDYIEHEQKVKVTRTYVVLPIDTPHKGDINLVRLYFSKLSNKNGQGFEKQMGDLENTFGPLTSHEKDSLLSQLSRITEDSSNGTSGFQTDNSHGVLPEIKLTGISNTPSKKGLIEEINDNKIQTPKYSLETCESEMRRQLVLKVDLPGVKSVSECQLDISEDDVMLKVPGHYELKVKLPNLIDDDQAIAKFSKKLSVLTLTMPART